MKRGALAGCGGGGGDVRVGGGLSMPVLRSGEERVALARARGRWGRGCGRVASPRVWSSRGLWQDAATRGCAGPREQAEPGGSVLLGQVVGSWLPIES